MKPPGPVRVVLVGLAGWLGLVVAAYGAHRSGLLVIGPGARGALGWIGLASLLGAHCYPLARKLGLPDGIGSRWFTVHVGLGFLGSALVTVHAAFRVWEFPRVGVIALWAMLLLVLSGTAGAYVRSQSATVPVWFEQWRTLQGLASWSVVILAGVHVGIRALFAARP